MLLTSYLHKLTYKAMEKISKIYMVQLMPPRQNPHFCLYSGEVSLGRFKNENKKWFLYEMRVSLSILNDLDVYQMVQPTPKHLQVQDLYKMR